MSRFDWLSELLARFQDEHILVHKGSSRLLAPAHVLHIDSEDWGPATREAARYGCRWCGSWAEDLSADFFANPHPGRLFLEKKLALSWFDPFEEMAEKNGFFLLNTCYEKQGDYLILKTLLLKNSPTIYSQTNHYPAANRMERHIQDLFGIQFFNHPDSRPWTRHQAWSADQYPLRKTFPLAGAEPATEALNVPPDTQYPFLTAQGAGVHEIPVGPVHAGIIEPGHFRFQAVGENILHLEAHLGYVHKGIEKIAEGRDAVGLARLAGRVSGDSTVAHTWAACMAMERAIGLKVSPRAIMLRAIMAERERIANHLGDVGAICNDVGFSFAYSQFSRLREQWLRLSQEGFGHRLMMDCIIPGGVKIDLTPTEITHQLEYGAHLHTELHELEDILEQHAGLEDRLAGTGILTQQQAAQLGCLGYVGRASGCHYDTRHHAPYPPYDQLRFEIPVLTNGDVESRLHLRLAEIHVSLHLLYHFLNHLPTGDINIAWTTPCEETEGLGIVEGWRGEIMTHIRFNANGQITRYFPRDPSWFNWPALELLIENNIVPDFPVCNKSINGSYAGHDL
jgi:Ni,Fe-hydrogenase III large subunit